MVMRLSDCSRLRILRSMASSACIGMNSVRWDQKWDFIPMFAGMSREFEIYGNPVPARIWPDLVLTSGALPHADRARTPRIAVRAGTQSAVAVVVDHPLCQPHPAQ